MAVTFNTINNNTAFTQRSEKRKEAEKQVVAGGGAIGAVTATANARAAKAGVQGLRTANRVSRLASFLPKKVAQVWEGVCKDAKYIQGIIAKNKLFKYVAAPVGYMFGVIALISGIADIGKVVQESIEDRK